MSIDNPGERIEAELVYRRLHRTEPDYTQPQLAIPGDKKAQIMHHLALLYGPQQADLCFPELERIMRVYYAHKSPQMIEEDRAFIPSERFTEKDAILITYGDLVVSESEAPLKVLARVLESYSRNLTSVHILPFFPYSSDRGFSITDFEEIDPKLGTWEDVERLALHYRLMFDGVINHVSSKSRWFQEYLNGHPEYEDYFIGFSTRKGVDDDHLKLILRPRTSDLLHSFESINGPRYVWTTFSRDQVDLNFHNPKVLLRIVEVLLYYVRRGADIIRLDSVTYLWHELGTECAHLQQTHTIIQLFRAILDVVAPRVALVSETNVPHRDNISYFGDGTNEAQMIYNFALPPLVLHTLQTGDSSHLSHWAASLEKVSETATYFNFLDSHDGIGLLGAQGILSDREIEAMIEMAKSHGGLVSNRTDGWGNEVPYELNVTWWSALNRAGSEEDLDLEVDRYIASRSIALVLRGVPGIYLLGTIGSENDLEAVQVTGESRSINRTTLDAGKVDAMLADPDSHAGRIGRRMRQLLAARVRCPAFHPNAEQEVMSRSGAVFALLRRSVDGTQTVLALTNLTDRPQEFVLEKWDVAGEWPGGWRDLLGGERFQPTDDALTFSLASYQVVWAAAEPSE